MPNILKGSLPQQEDEERQSGNRLIQNHLKGRR